MRFEPLLLLAFLGTVEAFLEGFFAIVSDPVYECNCFRVWVSVIVPIMVLIKFY